MFSFNDSDTKHIEDPAQLQRDLSKLVEKRIRRVSDDIMFHDPFAPPTIAASSYEFTFKHVRANGARCQCLCLYDLGIGCLMFNGNSARAL